MADGSAILGDAIPFDGDGDALLDLVAVAERKVRRAGDDAAERARALRLLCTVSAALYMREVGPEAGLMACAETASRQVQTARRLSRGAR